MWSGNTFQDNFQHDKTLSWTNKGSKHLVYIQVAEIIL